MVDVCPNRASSTKWMLHGSCVLKPSEVECPSISSIYALDDTWLTPDQHVCLQSVESLLIIADTPFNVDRYMYIWVGQHSANYQPIVGQVSIRCQSSVD